MGKSASRRGFLQHMTALGALGGASAGIAASGLRAAEPRLIAQAQPGAASAPQTRAFETAETLGLPRIQLMIGPGTLPIVGKDRMDLLPLSPERQPAAHRRANARTATRDRKSGAGRGR